MPGRCQISTPGSGRCRLSARLHSAAMKMKHEETIRNILAALHQPWMDEEDKREFDEKMLALHGAEMDARLDEGIKNGYSLEQQKSLALAIIPLL